MSRCVVSMYQKKKGTVNWTSFLNSTTTTTKAPVENLSDKKTVSALLIFYCSHQAPLDEEKEQHTLSQKKKTRKQKLEREN